MTKALVVGGMLSLMLASCASPSGSQRVESESSPTDGTISTSDVQDSAVDEDVADVPDTTLNADTSGTVPTTVPPETRDTIVTEQPPSTEPGDPSPDTTRAELPPDEPPPEGPPAGYDGPLANLVAMAIEDLTQRRSATASDVTVVSAESVVWPDSSLGCPIPDMRYTQVQVDGAQIVLALDGGVYTYHSGAGRDPFLCVPTRPSTDQGTTKLTLPPRSDTPTTTIDPDA